MTDTHASPTALFRWSSQHDDDRFPVENPATGQVIAVVQGGGAAEIDGAVRAADNAFKAHWRMRTAQDRGRLLLAGADVLQAHGDELATLESLENGKPVVDAWLDVAFLIGVLRFFGGLVDKRSAAASAVGGGFESVLRHTDTGPGTAALRDVHRLRASGDWGSRHIKRVSTPTMVSRSITSKPNRS